MMRPCNFLHFTKRCKLNPANIFALGRGVAVVALAFVSITAILASAQAQDVRRVKVTVGDITSFSQLGLYVGMQKGLFEKQGIDIERVVMPGGSKVLGTLLSGDIDIGYFAVSAALQAQIQGRPIKIIGASHDMDIYTLVGRNDLKNTFTKAADLKGRTIGITTIGSGSWAFAKLIASFAKLDPKSDFSIVPVGNLSALISALKTNRVDAVTLWEPGTTTALNEGAGYPIIDLVDPKQHEQFLAARSSLVEVIAVRNDAIAGKGDMLRRFFKAQNEAYAWIHSHSVDELAEAVAPVVGMKNMDILKQALSRTLPGVPTIATVDESLFSRSMKRLVDNGVLEKSLSFSEAVDNTYAGIK